MIAAIMKCCIKMASHSIVKWVGIIGLEPYAWVCILYQPHSWCQFLYEGDIPNHMFPASNCSYVIPLQFLKFCDKLFCYTLYIKWLWVSWKSVQWKPYFTYECKWISVCTFYICGPVWVKFGVTVLTSFCEACVTFVKIMTEVKNALVKSSIFNSTTTSLSSCLIIPSVVNFLVWSQIKAPLTFLYIVVVNCLALRQSKTGVCSPCFCAVDKQHFVRINQIFM